MFSKNTQTKIPTIPIGLEHKDKLTDQLTALELDLQTVKSYLKEGTAIMITRHQVDDLFDPQGERITAGILSDGDWAWSLELCAYVWRYNHGLPEEFLQHIKSRNGQGPRKLTTWDCRQIRTKLS